MPANQIDLTLFTREQKICLALWRKAFREKDADGPNVRLVLSSKSTALSVRLNCYRAIKPFRDEKYFDPELKAASEQFAVSIKEYDKIAGTWLLELTPRKSLNEMEAQLGLLGIGEDDLLLPEEKEALGRLAEFVQPSAHEASTTKFYERE